MPRKMIGVCCFVVVLGSFALAQRAEKSGTVRAENLTVRSSESQRAADLYQRLRPSAKAWVDQQALAVLQKSSPDVETLRVASRNRFASGTNLSALDIDSIVAMVLYQASQDADKDLSDQMKQMQQMNESKKKLRELQDQVKAEREKGASTRPDSPCPTATCKELAARADQVQKTSPKNSVQLMRVSETPTYAELRHLELGLQSNQDSLADMSQVLQLKMQMAMDRRSKVMEALSNIMKKSSDTQSSVISNLK